MKKIRLFTLLAVLSVVLAVTACNGDTAPSDTDPLGDVTTVTQAPEEDPPADDSVQESVSDDTTSEPDETRPSGVVMADVYPAPVEITYAESYTGKQTIKPDDKAAAYADDLASLGVKTAEDGLPLTVTLRDMTADFSYGADEAYVLTITDEGITVEAQTDRGVHYAFMTLLQIVEDSGAFPLVTVKDAPRNQLRGVIEGFYGTAWTHEYRKDLFAFMGQNKMNAYIYAPKDDPKHRAQWRALYTGAELQRMTDLIETANENYVKFIYAISPGGDINLGSGYEADFEKLMAKCEQIYELGCRDFAIFLDDIPTLDAEGHAKLLNDFQTKFVETHEGVSDLIAITTEYTDPFLTAYTDKIAPLIHQDIILMWTGPGVVPDKITNASLRNIIRKYGRNVLIWWNYPVNDVLVNNLYMGACEGLETTLYESITGLTANPMNQGYASMAPLFTTADYLWNPEAYNGEASLMAACESLMPDAAEALLHFISMTCASPMNQYTDSAELKGLLDAFKKENNPETRAALKAYFEGMIRNAAAITASANTDMTKEITEWVAKYAAYGEMGLRYVDMEEAYAEGKSMADILPMLGQYKTAEASVAKNPRLVSNYVLTPFFSTLTSRFATLLGQMGDLTFAAATPYTNCRQYEDNKPEYMLDGDDSTYFWTAGTMNQSANGQTGYIGVDLGKTITVTNIYVATGMGGSDVLPAAIVEYSTDGKSWTVIHNGACGKELFLKGLSVQARYVRVRNGDPANTNWTKVRAFEVNTTRTVMEDPAAAPSVSTSLPTYQTYIPDNMMDRDENTYFWSGREGRAGDYIQLDLGRVTKLSRITFKAGVPAHSADYVNNGELSYSTDGSTWHTICAVDSRNTVKDVDISARYIRVTVKANQTSWITVSEFSAIGEDSVSPLLELDTDKILRTDLLTLTDGHYVTYFAPDANKAEGKHLCVTVGDTGKVTLIALALPESGLTVTVKSATGDVIQTIQLQYVTRIEVPVGSVIHIPLGNGLMLAEVEWEN